MMNSECRSDLIVFSFDKFGSDSIRTTKQMNRFALNRRVYFIEAPIIGIAQSPTYFLRKSEHQVIVIQPYLPAETSVFEQKTMMLDLLKELVADENISHYTIWTDTPKAMPFIRNLSAEIIVYDCLKNYSLSHTELEQELFQYADVVLTSGLSEKTRGPEVKILPFTFSNPFTSSHSHN